MSKERELFGKKIVPHHMLNYAEQIYDILVGEIELGRWKLDGRLPGVMNLAKELGFGTKTVQTAYDRLKQEGYVKSLGYRGTYLKSLHPQSPVIAGKIGVLVSPEQTEDPLVLWYEHVILQVARAKKMVVEVRALSGPSGEVSRQGGLFGADIGGIISLTPFPMPVRFGDESSLIPLVFLCPPYERCGPKVCADVRDAYFDLTSRLVRLGHTRIIFSEDSVEPDPRQTDMHREGYLEAMRENDLAVDLDAVEASRKVENSKPAGVVAHLKSLLAARKSERPTAIVAGSLGRAMALTRIAPLHKIEIPRDISVVAIGSAPTGNEAGHQITGMLPDFDHMVGLCIDLLDQQKTKGRSDFTKVHVRMHFVPGHTLRPA